MELSTQAENLSQRTRVIRQSVDQLLSSLGVFTMKAGTETGEDPATMELLTSAQASIEEVIDSLKDAGEALSEAAVELQREG